MNKETLPGNFGVLLVIISKSFFLFSIITYYTVNCETRINFYNVPYSQKDSFFLKKKKKSQHVINNKLTNKKTYPAGGVLEVLLDVPPKKLQI
jgi:hypothetical protein